MDSIHSISVDKAFKELSKALITPRFLELVEKWARFDGTVLESGDITVTNMGVFERTVEVADIDFSKDIMKQVGEMLGGNKKGKTKKEIEIYDVTKISNDCVMTEFSNIILIAKRDKDKKSSLDLKFRAMFPEPLFIYAVFEESSKETNEFPSFKTLKKHFESKKIQYHYSSLIESSSFGDYILLSYNEYTDRIRNYSSIQGDIRSLESDEDALRATKHIKVPKRFTYDGLQAYKKRQNKKMREKLNNNISKEKNV